MVPKYEHACIDHSQVGNNPGMHRTGTDHPKVHTVLATMFATLAIAAGLAVTGASAATAETISPPQVVPSSVNPPVGSIMPRFSDSRHLLRAGSDQFSVTIDSAPTTANPGQPVTITGHTSGFTAGNWVNAWVRLPDGSQFDDGGLVTENNTFSIPMTLMYPGRNTIQVSAGTWPTEQWSTPLTVDVTTTPTYKKDIGGTAVGVMYHNLHGAPVIVAEADPQPWPHWTPFFDIYKPNPPYGHDATSARQIQPNVYVGFDSPVAGSGLFGLPPNSSDFLTGIAWSNTG